MSHDFRGGYHQGMIDGFRRPEVPEPSVVRYNAWTDGSTQAVYSDGSTGPVVKRIVPEPQAEPTERDATPDEAFELGRVAGYDEAMRETAQAEPTDARQEVAAILVGNGMKPHDPRYYALIEAFAAFKAGGEGR